MNYHERADCRFCGSKNLRQYVDLGDQPPSNSFITRENLSREKRFPLKVFLCLDCSLSQLTGIVSAADIFDDYDYRSSTSKALVRHYQGMAEALVQRLTPNSTSGLMDIGCNDGILLNGYPKGSGRTIGVEPSRVADEARKHGHTVYNAFFTTKLARQILAEQGPMRAITATNVFAHIDDIHDVVEGVRLLLDEKGAFVIEAPYVVDMVEKNYFDTIYHEHLCYLGLTALSKLMNKHGLEVFDIERVDIGASGPAIRAFSQKTGGPRQVGPAVAATLAFEKSWGIDQLAPYQAFARRLDDIRRDLLALLNKLKASGAKLGAYGAPAKGNTLLNTFGLSVDLITEGIAETNTIKQGKLAPGSHIPVVSEEAFLARKPDYALLLTWNYLDFFLKNSPFIKAGGKFVVPLPAPRVCPN